MAHEVMVVDDAVMMRTVLRTVVESTSQFHVVATAANGKEALKQLEREPNLKLILVDLEMPEMDGFEFIRHAKLKTRAKIVVVSSVAVIGSPQAVKARQLGADAIVAKPSGAISLDFADKRGSELVRVMSALVRSE
jgi:two-component system chemotaxis response regulator CheB/two-component system chemotaxis response regulator CheY